MSPSSQSLNDTINYIINNNVQPRNYVMAHRPLSGSHITITPLPSWVMNMSTSRIHIPHTDEYSEDDMQEVD